MKKYDAILCIEPQINEGAYDDRVFGAGGTTQPTRGFKVGIDWDDPKMFASNNFGNMMRSYLDNMGRGYSARVTDFGKWVTVDVTYHNYITGRSASKTFLVVFKPKGNGIVLSTHNRYRTISGIDQAVSYIRSASNSLESSTQSKIG